MQFRRAFAAAFLASALTIGVVATPTPAPAGAVTITTGQSYVSIGDSYTAGAIPWYNNPVSLGAWAFGEWANSGFSSWAHLCGRAINNPWPARVRTTITASGTPQWRNASCSGAYARHVSQSQTENTQINGIQTINGPQKNQIDATTKAITVTLGGNDAQLLPMIDGCRSTCNTSPTAPWNNILGAGAGTVQYELDLAYDAIQAVQPAGAKVVVVQYPSWVPDNTINPGSNTSCASVPNVGLSSTAVDFIAQRTREVNQAIATAAAGRTGWSVVDLYAPSQAGPRHDMCAGNTNKWVTPITVGETAGVAWTYNGSGQVFPMHLNDAGHTALATTVGAAVLAA